MTSHVLSSIHALAKTQLQKTVLTDGRTSLSYGAVIGAAPVAHRAVVLPLAVLLTLS